MMPCTWSIDWGSVPDWVGGLGSATGVLFVYVGLRREIRNQRQERIEAKAAQARLIYAVAERQGEEFVKVTVENASGGPVFDVQAAPLVVTGDEQEAPQPQAGDDDGSRRRQRLNPGESFDFYLSRSSLETTDEIDVDLAFTDQIGARWHRSSGGAPQSVYSEGAPASRWWRRR